MDNPITIFSSWLEQAQKDSSIVDATAMTLATADKNGRPSARVVLLKGHDGRGFVFYTNLESRKSLELKENAWAALCFYWAPLGRQVRIEGKVQEVSAKEADTYFNSRPLISRIGAMVSKQSHSLESRKAFMAQVEEAKKLYSEANPPKRPANWSGWRVVPQTIEFWQDGEFRLHDRDLYTLDNGRWLVKKLYP